MVGYLNGVPLDLVRKTLDKDDLNALVGLNKDICKGVEREFRWHWNDLIRILG